MSENSASIQIKGLRDGLLATLSNAAWEDQRAVMLSQIDERPTFFRGARLAMDVGEQVLKVNELVELRDRLSERGVSLWAVVSESPTTETTAQLLGLATRISRPRPEELRHAPSDEVSDETALFINKTLRSGTRIEFPGHVVLLGDINPGAEIIAEGNVMVWGRLRGLVHAGSAGNRQAIICALDVNDAQVRIANFSESKIQLEKQSIPQVISLDEDDKIKTQNWQAG